MNLSLWPARNGIRQARRLVDDDRTRLTVLAYAGGTSQVMRAYVVVF
jgi:hypothetical protein